MSNREFYIGWMDRVPEQTARFVKKYLLILLPCVGGLAIIVALGQKRFGSGNYEFGELTKINGIYFHTPVPLLRIADGTDAGGHKHWMDIPLVGYGKHGAEGIMSEAELKAKLPLNGRELTLRGTLLYNDGKTLLEINPSDSPLVSFSRGESALVPQEKKDLGLQILYGEIVDPKCFFGVMKPGEGKPHSDCAIRCILGGIAPVFVVRDATGKANYYLISGKNAANIPGLVKPFVGRPVALQASLVQYDDWVVLYLGDDPGIRPLSYLQSHFGNDIIACAGH